MRNIMERHNMSTKSENINIRVAKRQRDLIDEAAKLKHKTRTSFILDAVTAEAENTILDQRIFLLSPAKYKEFLAALDKPPEVNLKLKKMLSKKRG